MIIRNEIVTTVACKPNRASLACLTGNDIYFHAAIAKARGLEVLKRRTVTTGDEFSTEGLGYRAVVPTGGPQ